MLAAAYYVVLLTTVVLYALFCRATGVRLASYSAGTFVAGFVLQSVPGYRVASGQVLPTADRGFDLEIYWVFLAFVVGLPLGLALGRLAVGNARLHFDVRPQLHGRMVLLLVAIAAYGLLYFRWLGDIPLNSLLLGSRDILEAIVRRVQITHQIGQMESLPVAFRYWRVMLQLFHLVAFLYFVQYLRRGVLNRAAIVLLFLALTYAHVFTLEKGPYVYVLAALFMLHAERRVSARALAVSAVAGLAALWVMYVIFMGASIDTWYAPLELVMQRLGGQSASTYVQVLYVREHGFLWLRGLDFQFARHFVDNDYIDLSVWAYRQISRQLVEMGVVGAAGGNAFAQLYFSFSWLAFPLFVLLVAVYAAVDQLLANALREGALPPAERQVLRAFYIGLLPFTAVGFVGSVFTVFGVPLFLNSALVFILALFAYVTRLSTLRVMVPA